MTLHSASRVELEEQERLIKIYIIFGRCPLGLKMSLS